MMTIDGNTVGVWFLPLTETSDWMLCLQEIERDKTYEMTYRFRYYKDDKVFESDDQKNWYKCAAPRRIQQEITRQAVGLCANGNQEIEAPCCLIT